MRHCFGPLNLLILLCLAPTGSVVAVDFQRDVAPILARRCLSCHNEREQKGDFRIDTRNELEASGYVEAGDSEASFLLEVIRPEGDRPPRMPKDSDPLTAKQIALIEAWVRNGAKWPDGVKLEPPKVTDRDWWSLRPMTVSTPPIPTDRFGADWIRTPIDAFVYQTLKRKGLKPSPEAGRRTLIRRLTYDLTGLPPTPQEIEAFLADDSPLAYEKLVERLLGSPQYGERWARHWLDVVHYADTHGYDKDKLRPNAWPYRDYVIRAISHDKPYARFVREQLAGDALYPDTLDGQVATGFIAAGPWDFIGHAEVPETKLDGKVARNLDRDNMVTNTMNTFCSLTVQCARCHHHKLDPVTMEDYYRLQAVFASIDRADREYDVSPAVARRRASLNARKLKLAREIEAFNAALEKAKTPRIRELERKLAALRQKGPGKQPTTLPRSPAYGYHSKVAKSSSATKWVQIDLGETLPVDDVYLFGANEYGFADFGFPDRFRVEVADDPNFAAPTLIGDFQLADAPRPGAKALRVQGGETLGRYIRVTATKLWSRRRKGQPKSDDWIFALGELAVVSRGKLVSAIGVQAADSIEAAPRWSRAALIDGIYGTHNLDILRGGNERSSTNGFHSAFAQKADDAKSLTLDLGSSRRVDRIRLTPAFPTDWPDTPGFGFPTRFRIEMANSSDFQDGWVVVDRTAADSSNPGQRRVEISLADLTAKERTARYVRVTATRLWDRGEKRFAFALAELEVFRGQKNLAQNAVVSAGDSIESMRWSMRHVIDGFTSRMPVTNVATDLAAMAHSPASRQEFQRLTAQVAQEIGGLRPSGLWQRQRNRETDLAAVEKEMDQLPKSARVYAGIVHRGSGAFRGRAGLGPRTIHVLHRGNVDQIGERVQSGAPPLTPGAVSIFGLDDEDPEWRRRVALAEWITHRDNPLTWRSIVNRVWVHHFGRGIADTPNDFGRGGKKPTHPELLDFLALEFRDRGGSLKWLHRMILTSGVYRQASEGNAESERIDADNQYYWRMNRRRLSAEEVRDSMLAVAGMLDRKRGGPGFKDFVIESPQHSPHYEYDKHDPNDMETHRRTIYRFIVRSQPQPFMDTLDCADPSISVPKRDETLTSLQALAMLNNQFVIAMAGNFSTRIQAESDDPEQQVRRALRLTLGRQPEAAEVAALTGYAKEHGLENACRLLFNLNEFVFVD